MFFKFVLYLFLYFLLSGHFTERFSIMIVLFIYIFIKIFKMYLIHRREIKYLIYQKLSK